MLRAGCTRMSGLDLRVALRALRKNAILTAIAILTLALGIGANSTMFSDVYRAAPLLGPTFLDGEDQAGRNLVAVLSYGFWQRHFGGDPKAVGGRFTLDKRSYAIAGVMPKDFHPFGPRHDLYIPYVL